MATDIEVDPWARRIVADMPFDVYLTDPVPGGSLSSSGARLLLPPSCPAKFDYDRKHPTMPKKDFDLGTAMHDVLLGTGSEVVVFQHADWRKDVAKHDKAVTYAAGKTPVLEPQMDMITDAVAAVRAHPIAGPLLDRDRGVAEVSLFWIDQPTGTHNRCRLDWLTDRWTTDGKRIIVDYKSCRSANPSTLVNAIRDYGYHQQAPFYIDGVIGTGLAEDAVFLFVFQEKEPPFLITVMELHPISGLLIGRELNDFARGLFAKCSAADNWPGYADDIVTATLPDWEMRKMEAIIGADPIRGVAA